MRYIVTLFFAIIVCSACDDILNQKVEQALPIDEALNNTEGAINVLNSAYVALQSGGAYDNAIIIMTELASDNGYTQRRDEFKRFDTPPSQSEIQSLWSTHYQGIARSNIILDGVESISFQEQSLKDAIKGQAYFLRGLFYFNLVRFFGGVPLITKAIERPADAEIEHSSIENLYQQIESDLNEAIELLPEKYNSEGRGFEEGRATKGAAQGLLAKVHLTQEEWAEAATAAKEVIDSGVYQLQPDYNNNFRGNDENGIESLFEVQFSAESGATGSFLSNMLASVEIVQGNGLEFVIPTNDTLDVTGLGATNGGIVQAFEDGDNRKAAAISTYDLPNHFPIIHKYYAGPSASENRSPVNVPVLRYADVLLIRAEALNEMGQNRSEAIDIINNQIRDRAGLDPLPSGITGDQSSFRLAIRQERRVELSFENERIFDLNRYGILKEKLADQGINIDERKIIQHPITGKNTFLYPIPINELTTNPNAEQNPGY